jgi:TRAP-type C4-dicarboxylate transport system permease small subunit
LDSQEGLSGRDSEISAIFEEGIEDRDIRVIVADTIRIFLGFLGIIFVVLLIIAGFKYMTAGGNEENVNESLKQIKHAIIGLIIILAAYAIATFVVAQVRKAVIDPSF